MKEYIKLHKELKDGYYHFNGKMTIYLEHGVFDNYKDACDSLVEMYGCPKLEALHYVTALDRRR